MKDLIRSTECRKSENEINENHIIYFTVRKSQVWERDKWKSYYLFYRNTDDSA